MISSVSSGKDAVNSNTLEDSQHTVSGTVHTGPALGRRRSCEWYRLSKGGVQLFGDVSIFGVEDILSNFEDQVRVGFTVGV